MDRVQRHPRLVGAFWLVAVVVAMAFIGSRLYLHLDSLSADDSGYDKVLAAFAVFAALIVGTWVVLWFGYKTTPAPEAADLPPLTVVIPAFNEGPPVRLSIQSVLNSAYPAERLTVIVVNDGSSDDTAAHIDEMAQRFPDRVRAVHLPGNRGKRHALYAGFTTASTPFVATLDSDSELDPDALANIVAPMVADPKIGGVAGKVLVSNRGQSTITRMLAVCYTLGFDFVRAYQSRLRNVWCCPGALQAYRLDLVKPHLDTWLNQTFFGAKCTNGDDHAMTSTVLRLDSDTCYQSSAIVGTMVPHTYKRLCKMYVRWARSATREGLLALRFAPRRAWRRRGWRGALIAIDAVLQPMGIAMKALAPLALLGTIFLAPHLLLPLMMSVLLGSMLYAIVFLRSEFSGQFVFGLLYTWFSLLTLSWIQPYAVITVRRNGWMTRG